MSGGEYASFSSNGETLVFVGISDVKIKKKRDYDTTFATMSINILDIKKGIIKTILKSPETFLDAGYIYSNPSLSPDGKLIAFQHSGSDVSGGFSVIDMKGKTVFSFPLKDSDAKPYWRPQFTPDGNGILFYSPATSDNEKDMIFLIDIKKGTKRLITEGANPVFACSGEAIIFEQWRDKWSPTSDASPDLWFLELKEGAIPKMILKNASSPGGHYYCSQK